MSSTLPPDLQVHRQPRRLRFYRFQWVGLSVMFLIPFLALLGVFGESWSQAEDASDDLVLRVAYPTRYRYKQINTVEILVENTSAQRLDTVIVAFDPAYVRRFSTLMFIPSPKKPFEIEFLDMKPGEARRVWAELQGEHYGYHRGTIDTYQPGGLDTARVAISTFIYP